MSLAVVDITTACPVWFVLPHQASMIALPGASFLMCSYIKPKIN